MSIIPDSNAIKEDRFYTRSQVDHLIALEREATLMLLDRTLNCINSGDVVSLFVFMQEYQKPLLKFLDPETKEVKKFL